MRITNLQNILSSCKVRHRLTDLNALGRFNHERAAEVLKRKSLYRAFSDLGMSSSFGTPSYNTGLSGFIRAEDCDNANNEREVQRMFDRFDGMRKKSDATSPQIDISTLLRHGNIGIPDEVEIKSAAKLLQIISCFEMDEQNIAMMMLSLQADLGELSDDTRLVPLCLITEKVFPEEFGRSELSRYFDGYFRAQSDKLFDNIATKRGDFAGLGNVLDAMRAIKRELFCPREEAIYAYNNSPLPIGSGQTISQPEIVAIMTALLDLHGTERVLEIGTGSGYQAAVLSRLAREVYTIERFPGLAEKAKIVLKQIGADNVAVIVGNGISGSIEKAPFDRILVTAMADHIPEALLGQLKEGGRMVIPVAKQKGGNFGMLNMIDRRGGEILVKEILLCAFVELVNEG